MAKGHWGMPGAFSIWALKGFKGKLDDEYNEKNNLRNFIVSIVVILGITYLLQVVFQ
jgi:hypothetical protein